MIGKQGLKMVAALFLLLSFFGEGRANAAGDISLSASVSRKQIPLNHNLTLSVTINGTSSGDPLIPNIQGFTERGRSSSTSISIINMDMVRSKTISVTLTPQKKGKFTIPAIELNLNGDRYSTKPIVVEVVAAVQGRQRAQQQQRRQGGFGSMFDDPFFRDPFGRGRRQERQLTEEDIFVEMVTNKKEAYVNEEIISTFSFYRGRDIRLYDNPSYAGPSFTGFWSESIPTSNKAQYEVLNGKTYVVSDVSTVLYPISSGDIVIDPGALACRLDPFSNPIELNSKPLTITIKPLPTPPPGVTKTGLVGFFEMHEEFSKKEVAAGDSVDLFISVQGVGNIKSIPQPTQPKMDFFDIYGPEEDERTSKKPNRVEGEKIFKYVLIPRRTGKYTVESFRLDYFDPEMGVYKSLKTKPFPLAVLAGESQDSSGGSGVGIKKSAIELRGKDIHYIKPDASSLEDYGSPLYKRKSVMALFILPLIILLGAYLYKQRLEKLESDTGYGRRSKAYKKAGKLLTDSEQLAKKGDIKEFYTLIENIMRGYIGDKLNIPAPSVEADLLRSQSTGEGDSLAENFQTILDTCSLARFAPSSLSSDSMSKTMEQVKGFLGEFEKKS